MQLNRHPVEDVRSVPTTPFLRPPVSPKVRFDKILVTRPRILVCGRLMLWSEVMNVVWRFGLAICLHDVKPTCVNGTMQKQFGRAQREMHQGLSHNNRLSGKTSTAPSQKASTHFIGQNKPSWRTSVGEYPAHKISELIFRGQAFNLCQESSNFELRSSHHYLSQKKWVEAFWEDHSWGLPRRQVFMGEPPGGYCEVSDSANEWTRRCKNNWEEPKEKCIRH